MENKARDYLKKILWTDRDIEMFIQAVFGKGEIMEEQLKAIIKRLNQEKFQRFEAVKTELLQIATPSTNPDNFTDLEDALNAVEGDLKLSLKGQYGEKENT